MSKLQKEINQAKEELINIYLNVKIRTQDEVIKKNYFNLYTKNYRLKL